MATFGTLNESSGINKDWNSYYERCEFYFVANTIEDNSVKRVMLLSVVGDTTYQLIRGLLSPKKLTEVDFSDIIRTLTGIQRCLLSERVLTYQQVITIANAMGLADMGTSHITGK